ncbi:MAG: RDD family protein [Candidatus Hermodarchaeota archaeon]
MSDKFLKEYIDQINRFLPYKKEAKLPVLDALREEVREALMDAGSNDPTTVYGAPRDVAKNLSLGQDWGVRASFKRRTVAYILDFFICIVVALLLAIFFTPMYLNLLIPEFFEILEEIPPNDPMITTLFITTYASLMLIINLPLSIFYFILLERVFSTTLAKRMLGLKVCDVSGIRITLKQSIIRNFSKLSFLFLILDVIMGRAMKEGEQQRVLDSFAETVVLKL